MLCLDTDVLMLESDPSLLVYSVRLFMLILRYGIFQDEYSYKLPVLSPGANSHISRGQADNYFTYFKPFKTFLGRRRVFKTEEY